SSTRHHLFVRHDPRLARLESRYQTGFLLGRKRDGFIYACDHVAPGRELSQLLWNIAAVPFDDDAARHGATVAPQSARRRPEPHEQTATTKSGWNDSAWLPATHGPGVAARQKCP